jgi:hypothetical protein
VSTNTRKVVGRTGRSDVSRSRRIFLFYGLFFSELCHIVRAVGRLFLVARQFDELNITP